MTRRPKATSPPSTYAQRSSGSAASEPHHDRNQRQALVAASLVYAGPSLARSGLTSQDAVGLRGLPVGVAALVLSVALRKPPEGGLAELARGWASTLAGQV